MAIHEARLLWGRDTPIQTIVSLGTGLYKKNEREPANVDKITNTSLKEKIIKVVAGATDTESKPAMTQIGYRLKVVATLKVNQP